MKRIPIADLSKNVLNLPRLGIPSITNTMDRYRASVLALKSGESVTEHFAKLDEFVNKSAAVLQKTIVENDKAAAEAGVFPFSYVEQLQQRALLTSRSPLEVKHNKAFVLKKDAVVGTDGTQAGVAAGLVYGIAKWIEDVRRNGLVAPEPSPSYSSSGPKGVFDVSPLLSEFGRSLIPTKDADEVHTTPFEKLQHVVVLHDGHLYCLKVFDEKTGVVHDRALIQKAFEVLLTVTPDADNATPVSVLTAGNRTVWAQAYQELVKTPENAAELQTIHEGVLVVCLDSKPWSGDEKRAEAAALHGSTEEMENRWYDKHQMIVSADGQVAFNFEPTYSHRAQWAYWIDGVMNILAAEGQAGKAVSTASMDAAATAVLLRHMSITYGKSFATHIRNARQEATALVTDTEVHSLVLPFGREEIAAFGISPDAFVQLTLQVARFMSHEKLCATSETCSTTGFFHGSSEILRSATSEARALAERASALKKRKAAGADSIAAGEADAAKKNAEADPSKATATDAAAAASATKTETTAAGNASAESATAATGPTISTTEKEELAKLIQVAARKHDELIVAANGGQGVDRHLMALRHVATLNGDKAALAFFEDELYQTSSNYLLNTCEFSRPWLRSYTFGPSGPNGYGLGYVVDAHEVRMALSAHADSPATDVADMTTSIHAAALMLSRCLGGAN